MPPVAHVLAIDDRESEIKRDGRPVAVGAHIDHPILVRVAVRGPARLDAQVRHVVHDGVGRGQKNAEPSLTDARDDLDHLRPSFPLVLALSDRSSQWGHDSGGHSGPYRTT